ncbi:MULTISPECIES: GpE family phage tail protein [Paraburkholderia]|uniref:GpE family phage tail protein n=1 Tax=Paraburkholderia guartelaensis TaxID=2546446 RepID=A0ABU9SKK0_9BURK|nr:GpE family phage tail protein [Paraburkholderia nodosa]
MADIATVFTGWTPRDMHDFTLVELAEWRERARARSGTE